MASPHATSNQQHAGAIPQGTPVTISTTTQVPVQPVVNPLTAMENWTPIFALLAGIGLIVGWMGKHITGKIGDFKDAHKPVHDAIDMKLLEVSHKLANEKSRINILETYRGNDIERIVKLETNMHNIEKSQERIEHALDKMAIDLGNRIDHWSEQLSASIREVREVKPRT